jgi:hypothetical protein
MAQRPAENGRAMTITLEIPDDLADYLAATGTKPEEVGRYVITRLRRIARQFQIEGEATRAWWESLSAERRQEELARIEKSSEAADAGMWSSAEDVYARVRAGRARRPAE